MKPSRISRVVKILTTLQSGRSYSANTLAGMFGLSRRTIFRDLQELGAIGIPFRYNNKECGYTIDSEYFLPPIDLKMTEALSLLLLVHKLGNTMQFPLKNSALMAAMKIETNLPEGIRNYCNTALQNIQVKTTPQAIAEMSGERFTELQKAVAQKRKVKIVYNSLYEHTTIELELHPYHLLFCHRAWYVVGFSELHNQIRTFKLSRITQLELTDLRFTDEEKFDVYDYFGKAWCMIPQGRLYDIKLRFLPKVAENVTEVKWHSTQKVSILKDKSAIIEFRVDGLNEISWWILGYGDQVEVLKPKALRKIILDTAKNMVKMNE